MFYNSFFVHQNLWMQCPPRPLPLTTSRSKSYLVEKLWAFAVGQKIPEFLQKSGRPFLIPNIPKYELRFTFRMFPEHFLIYNFIERLVVPPRNKHHCSNRQMGVCLLMLTTPITTVAFLLDHSISYFLLFKS